MRRFQTRSARVVGAAANRAGVALAFILAIAGVLALSAFSAKAFPEKPVDYVIPFGADGESDRSAQMQNSVFVELFDHPLDIRYQPGGGGSLGWSTLNSLPADGHAIMGVNLPHIVIQPAQKDVGYTTEELSPVYWFHYTPDAIIVPKDSPFESLSDLVAYAREKPGVLSFSGSGLGSANHLAKVMFDKAVEIQTAYIPFKGSAAAITALEVGQVMAYWGYSTAGIAHRDDVRLLAIAMEERHPAFSNVPTFRELGVDMVGGAYRGVALPMDTPDTVKSRWSDMIGEINADPSFRAKMEAAGFALVDVPFSAMEQFMAERRDFYLNAAREAGVL